MVAQGGRPLTLMEAVAHFSVPGVAEKYIKSIKWPDGACCPECGSVNVGAIKTRCRYQCREKECRRQFSLLTGTIFEASHLKLSQWCLALWMIANCKNGVSSCEIARAVGCKQQSAWHLLHRIRHLHTQQYTGQMSGTIESDCTFVGGQFKFMNHKAWERARKSPRPHAKTVVHAMVCRDTGEVRAAVVDGEKRDCTEPAIRKHVARGSYLFTDNGAAYRWARYTRDYEHFFVNHSVGEYARGAIHTNTMEGFFNCLRRGLKGTYIRASHDHLDAYVDEQVFRYNCRKLCDWERFDRTMRMIVGKRLTYRELTGGATR